MAKPVLDWRSALTAMRDRLRSLQDPKRTILIGIDGRGGSGKSTLARELAHHIDAPIVQFDDFYCTSDARRRRRISGESEIGADFDWRRVRSQVLEPLSAERSARYQRYDWDADEMAGWHEIAPGGVVIVEGTFSTRPELRAFYDLTVWVRTPDDVRLERGLARDGYEARDRWLHEWMVEEDRYIEAVEPQEQVDFVVDGSGGAS